jgi:FMN-dependent oxidoreductase (nitrilotriacetate monooxygenase family)
MASPARMMRLGVFLNITGHHVAAWRHPRSQADGAINFKHYVEMAKTAERAKCDMIFLADTVAVRVAAEEAVSRSAQYVAGFEPITLISAMAALTERIGFVSTCSTSYSEPYNVARMFASFDHISGGRGGWNIVTTGGDAAAQNYGREEHYGHAERYERAREFTKVVTGLWDSWDDDAFVLNRESGLYFDPKKLHALHHKGKWFSVKGPLNVPRSPQGQPVLVQAGASNDGRNFAAEYAEAIFTGHLNLESAQEYYSDLKSRAKGFGRDPSKILVMPGLSPVVGRTQKEADEKQDYLQSLVHPIVAREVLSMLLNGVDLSSYPLDGPLPELKFPANAGQSTAQNWINLARRENLSIRELAYRATHGRGKAAIVGTPEKIADYMQEWFEKAGADGFNIQPPVQPGFLDDFVELVIPILQERGLFRREYEGSTLRENLGLPRPVSRYRNPAYSAVAS